MNASDQRKRFGMDRSPTLGRMKTTGFVPYNTPGLAILDNTHYLPHSFMPTMNNIQSVEINLEPKEPEEIAEAIGRQIADILNGKK